MHTNSTKKYRKKGTRGICISRILTDPYGYGFSLHPVPSNAGWARNACVWFLHHNSRQRSCKNKFDVDLLQTTKQKVYLVEQTQ